MTNYNNMYRGPGGPGKPLAYQRQEPPAPARREDHQLVYPDVYYIMKPHIDQACNRIGQYGRMPTQEELEQMADGVYDELMRSHPELGEYMQEYGQNAEPYKPTQFGRGRGYYGRRGFRRRGGLFRDLIGILLLQQLFGRRFGFF